MHVLLLHPVARWSLERVVDSCSRNGWRLTIVTIESSTVAEGVPGIDEWIRVAALTDCAETLVAQVAGRSFDAVAAGNEFAVVAADVLAHALDLPHNDVAAIVAARDKAAMRRLFAAAGVPQPVILAQTDTAHPDVDWSAIEFPVVVKPVDMAMSLFVRRCDSAAEAEAVLELMRGFTHSRLTNYPFSPHALVEQFVPGPEFSLECVVSAGRVVAQCTARKFSSALPACYEVAHLVGEEIPARHRADIVAIAEQIARGWGMANGVMHVEFKLAEDQVWVIEAAARPSGGHLPEIVELQTGINLEEAHLRARLGLDADLSGTDAGAEREWYGIRFEFPERAAVSLPEVVGLVRSHSGDEVLPGAEPFSVNRRAGYSILRSTDRDALARCLEAL